MQLHALLLYAAHKCAVRFPSHCMHHLHLFRDDARAGRRIITAASAQSPVKSLMLAVLFECVRTYQSIAGASKQQ